MRLVDAEDYPYKNGAFDLQHGNKHFIRGIETMQEWIDTQPTVDAVPVVRCGECINYGYRNRHWDDICLKNEPKGCRKWLDKTGMFIIGDSNAFCSYGERKVVDNENR